MALPDVALNVFMILVSVSLVFLETIVSSITLLLPQSVIDACTRTVKEIIQSVPNKEEARYDADPELHARVNKLMNANSFVEMCALFGYKTEEHIVQTVDGYLLGAHRIVGKLDSPNRSKDKPVVYLHHGLLMNSEVWVSATDSKNSVAFALSDLGYDVWLGNNRGNKYSKKHLVYTPSSNEFWNFSIDEFALYDIPNTIEYILETTGQKSLVYIGFSQGTSQAFASLSIHPKLNKKVKLFIALAPAMAPPGIQPKFVQTFMNLSPSLLFTIFGKKIILRSTSFWQSIMFPALFVRVIDLSMDFLFHWTGKNITYPEKLIAYNHLYSFTSVKSVVHWFQIIRAGSLQMYDDDMNSWGPAVEKYYRIHQYPTQNIETPIAIIYGTTDSLVDIHALRQSIPLSSKMFGVEGYEHLDILWGKAVPTVIIPKIVEYLESAEPVRPLTLPQTPTKQLEYIPNNIHSSGGSFTSARSGRSTKSSVTFGSIF